jgi:hypothetical protein
MVSLRILCAKLSTVGIGKKDHSKQSDTQVALTRTLQIGHRSGNALKKIAGPSVRVYTVHKLNQLSLLQVLRSNHKAHRRKQSQVANHTCSIQFNEIEGLERFG